MMVALLAVFAAPAFASMLPFYKAQLNRFMFQPGSVLSALHFDHATISIAPKVGNLTLTLTRNVKCEAGKMCPKIAFAPVTYQVPAEQMAVGACNETVYAGVVDNRQNGGELVQMSVTDNSHNTCKAFAPMPATEVLLTIQGGPDALNERHVLTGSILIEQI